jgi:hypothetical protein
MQTTAIATTPVQGLDIQNLGPAVLKYAYSTGGKPQKMYGEILDMYLSWCAGQTVSMDGGDRLSNQPTERPPTTRQKILAAIMAASTGVDIAGLAAVTGLPDAQIAATTATLRKQDKIYLKDGLYFIGSKPTRTRGRPPKVAAASTNGARKPSAAPKSAASGAISLANAVLQAVNANPGSNPAQIMTHLKTIYPKPVRPNHLGTALARHRRAGRLVENPKKIYYPATAAGASEQQMAQAS